MKIAERLREWRVDRLTDRMARRPHGRRARMVYGAADAHAFLWEPVLAALALQPDDRLLDVGCGGGVFLRRALEAGCAGAGLDHSREMVRLALTTLGGAAPIIEGDAEAMPLADGCFTAVSCLVAFFLFRDPIAALREMRRVLEPARGRVAIMTTAPEAKGTPALRIPWRSAAASTPTTNSCGCRSRRAFPPRRSRTARRGRNFLSRTLEA